MKLQRMDKIFLDYNTCKRLKSLGFNESCLGYYHNNSINPEVDLFVTGLLKLYSENQNITLACTYEQCLKWLREEHQIYVDAYFKADIINSTKVIITMITNKVYDWSDGEKVKSWDVVYNKGFSLLDEKYRFNLKQYPNDEKYKLKTFTREEALEEGLKVALELI
jgi:hypothetical protein